MKSKTASRASPGAPDMDLSRGRLQANAYKAASVRGRRKKCGRGLSSGTEVLNELVHRAQIFSGGLMHRPPRHGWSRSDGPRASDLLRFSHESHVGPEICRIGRAPSAAMAGTGALYPVLFGDISLQRAIVHRMTVIAMPRDQHIPAARQHCGVGYARRALFPRHPPSAVRWRHWATALPALAQGRRECRAFAAPDPGEGAAVRGRRKDRGS